MSSIPVMVIETYISFLQQKYKPIEYSPGDQALEVLTEFSAHNYRSAYDVYSALKDTHFPAVDYKNTHKRVKRLESLGFIEPLKVEETNGKKVQHGALYYRITEAGMFQWFLFRQMLPLLPSVLQIHGDYLIFKTLLYPYFTKDTIVALKEVSDRLFSQPGPLRPEVFRDINFQIFGSIYNYLRDCCWLVFEDIYTRTTEPYITLSSAERQEHLESQLIRLRNNLFVKILLWFSAYDKEKQMDAVVILAKDDKFMNIADDMQRDLKHGFDIATYLRTKP
jgi:hypothetical protein